MQRCKKELKDWLETEAENISSSFTNIIQKIAEGVSKRKSKTGDNQTWFDYPTTQPRNLGVVYINHSTIHKKRFAKLIQKITGVYL